MKNANDNEYTNLTQQQIMKLNETQDILNRDTQDNIILKAFKKKK